MTNGSDRFRGPSEHLQRLRAFEVLLQRKSLALLGLEPEERSRVVGIMLDRRRDAVGYWLQLIISMGIATIGLAMGSGAVVIGAMLIAPLMGPIVELGMALVIGSPALTLRSLLRTAGSVGAVVLGAAILTLSLPFHEITPEIASRTVPTALDLGVAVFVALAGVFTTVRTSSETTSAAAGASIGIALVPPVCVMGFGLGIGDASVAGGATLLFVTNFTAILFVSVLGFWMMGFEHVDASEWEAAAVREADDGSLTLRAMVGLERMFGSRYSRVLRVGIPALLIAATYIPLSTALDQVAWEVRARTSITRILGELLAGHSTVQQNIAIDRRNVTAEVYLVGTPDTARVLREAARAQIAAATGVDPAVRIVAVPDVAAVRSMAMPTTSERREPPPASRLSAIHEAAGAAIQSVWPAEEIGELVTWNLAVGDSMSAPILELRFLGAENTPGLDALFSRAISDRLGAVIQVRTDGIPTDVAAASHGDVLGWLPAFLDRIEEVRRQPRLHACVTIPTPNGREAARRAAESAQIVRSEAARGTGERVTIDEGGDDWRVQLLASPCPRQDAAAEEDAAA